MQIPGAEPRAEAETYSLKTVHLSVKHVQQEGNYSD